jgi:hypothetical protein
MLWEVPQTSTGFSPFELLYGRPWRGILDLPRKAWENQPCQYRTFIEHITFMMDKMAAIWPGVREHMAKVQETQAWVYNKTAQLRQFCPGDKILVPKPEHRLQAWWHGQYVVTEQVSSR